MIKGRVRRNLDKWGTPVARQDVLIFTGDPWAPNQRKDRMDSVHLVHPFASSVVQPVQDWLPASAEPVAGPCMRIKYQTPSTLRNSVNVALLTLEAGIPVHHHLD